MLHLQTTFSKRPNLVVQCAKQVSFQELLFEFCGFVGDEQQNNEFFN